MDHETYNELYMSLETRPDLERLVRTSSYDEELLTVIYTQRVVRDATKRFYKVKRNSRKLRQQWRQGTTFVELARRRNFPPILVALLVMGEEGVSRKAFWKMVKDLDRVRENRLRRELKAASEEDLIYSPAGTERQYQRGAWGEARLWEWLEAQGIPFRKEAELRNSYDKTPDALLQEPFEFDGRTVRWIESKASFGDPYEIKRHVRRQLRPYVDLFGEGVVVYWFGFVDDVDLRIPDGVLITDERPFSSGG
ncbi:MAG: C15orf41 family protein [Thermoplasmata archaeon]